MATLKFSDLSVGDWVRYDDRICQIAEIYHLTYNIGSKKMTSFPRVTLYYEDDMPTYQESVILKDIRPIPITAEILEKNGWKLSKSNWFEFEDGEWKINIWIGKSKCNIEISQKREIYMSTYADIQVVKSNINTLQHALRLAGLDKEINL